MERREWLPLVALALILVISAAWWSLALWPLPADAPDWIQRTRAVCFGALHDTLPTPAGWSLLIGEPLAMLGALVVIWPRQVRDGLRRLWRTVPGRVVELGTAAAVLLGLTLAAGRVRAATRGEAFDPGDVSAAVQRLSRPAPAFSGLVDQRGNRITSDTLRGRPYLIAFVYAHCTTVCPVVVHEVFAARREARSPVPVVLVTLDPWRDTPSRLASMASAWELTEQDYLLSGTVGEVQAALDAWGIARTRDTTSGEISHATPVYFVDASATVRYQAPPSADAIRWILQR